MRLIDAETLLKYFSVAKDGSRFPLRDCDNFPTQIQLKEVQDAIRKAPTIDADPVVHAHWKNYCCLDQCCSNCGETPECEEGETPPDYDICPYCGAHMDESPTK